MPFATIWRCFNLNFKYNNWQSKFNNVIGIALCYHLNVLNCCKRNCFKLFNTFNYLRHFETVSNNLSYVAGETILNSLKNLSNLSNVAGETVREMQPKSAVTSQSPPPDSLFIVWPEKTCDCIICADKSISPRYI